MIRLGLAVNNGRAGGAFVDEFSLKFNGSSKAVNIDSLQSAIASDTVGTINFWAKVVDATPPTQCTLVGFGDSAANTFIHIFINSTTGRLTFNARLAGVNLWSITTDAQALVDDTWVLIGCRQDGVLADIFINGVKPAQSSSVSSPSAWFTNIGAINTGRLAALNFNGGGDQFFCNCNIDDFTYSSTDLSDAQMLAIGGVPKDQSAQPGLVSYYRFENDTVPTIVDSKGSNNGTGISLVQGDYVQDVP